MTAMLGHNRGEATITVELRLFNSAARGAANGDRVRRLTLPIGSTVGDVIAAAGVAREAVFLVMVNGRDVTPGRVGDAVNGLREVDDGDVVALSGPVPYSWGYGAPVV